MGELVWGLLGPEAIGSERRSRTLGVGASVRAFNDLAVPGLGGVWFGKQVFLAVLGVKLAEEARAAGKHVQNIETANAVEALGCFLAFLSNNWRGDARLLGVTKMEGRDRRSLSFDTVRKPGFYVTQPMRMATVQTLPRLGLVRGGGSRFNSFRCAQPGADLIEAAFEPYGGAYAALKGWAVGKSDVAGNRKLQQALSPLEPLPKAASDILHDRLIQGCTDECTADKERRRSALRWVESLRAMPEAAPSWTEQPAGIRDDHWHDLKAGALFFAARDLAIEVLDSVETLIIKQEEPEFRLGDSLPAPVRNAITDLRQSALEFLDRQHTDVLANAFCRECVEADEGKLLSALVQRDERVLRLRGDLVLPGPACRRSDGPQNTEPAGDVPGAAQMETSETPATGRHIEWPEGMSRRVHHLFLLNADLRGELSPWLGQAPEEAVPEEYAHG